MWRKIREELGKSKGRRWGRDGGKMGGRGDRGDVGER